jgi:hypothetical protein
LDKPRRIAFLCCAALAPLAAQTPALPEGARTVWIVRQPQELVTWLAFDPRTVQSCLPQTLRFITVGELATGGAGWAKGYLSTHPDRGAWGVSFLEILRAGTFTLDGRTPGWPKEGGMALWCARVAPMEPSVDLGGQPYLALEFWMSDRSYVAYMSEKGHPASYGEVRLRLDSKGHWQGSVKARGLDLTANCAPVGPIRGGAGLAGMQILFPPREAPVQGTVRVAFAGHRIQDCAADATWTRRGTHPLVGAEVLRSSTYQFGYELRGGAYPALFIPPATPRQLPLPQPRAFSPQPLPATPSSSRKPAAQSHRMGPPSP